MRSTLGLRKLATLDSSNLSEQRTPGDWRPGQVELVEHELVAVLIEHLLRCLGEYGIKLVRFDPLIVVNDCDRRGLF